MPKFRGKTGRHQDDWLDVSEVKGKRHKHHEKKPTKTVNPHTSGTLEPEEANGTVVEVFHKLARVRCDEDSLERLCAFRRAQVHQQVEAGRRDRSPVAVGDRVKVKVYGAKDGLIEGVTARTNFLSRPATGREGLYQIIASNLDGLCIVTSVSLPEFTPGLVDRFLIGAQRGGVPACIVVNKIDLDHDHSPWEIYPPLGIPVFEVSTQSGKGVSALQSFLKGKRIVFAGHSGVGKTSLLRRLLDSEIGKVGEVSHFNDKGKHTTTSAVMYQGPDHSLWIDTPGVRSFSLEDCSPEEVQEYFPELADLPCTADGCDHTNLENPCPAFDLPRHSSYLKMVENLREGREGD